jgi:hypothetical protein
MPAAGFEPAIPGIKRLQNYALDHTANRIEINSFTAYGYVCVGCLCEMCVCVWMWCLCERCVCVCCVCVRDVCVCVCGVCVRDVCV